MMINTRAVILLCLAGASAAGALIAFLAVVIPNQLANQNRVPFTCTTFVDFAPVLCQRDGLTLQCYSIYRSLQSGVSQ